MSSPKFTVVEATIDDLQAALSSGVVTSVELVIRYLNRIAFYDRAGLRLNSITTINPTALDEARQSDLRRVRGEARGPLEGIAFTAKDSYCVAGLPVSAGSPAFARLTAKKDAFAISRLRNAGAVFLGLTNMPPMAAGGMQRGLYGRAESPYNPDYLTSAFGSGSSNGSGTATAASFAAFGLGEETWSSGRAPASNNSLVAYTPSRGMISVRGNWPLVPTMDVVVPHTRSTADMARLLDVLVADDSETEGDLWRMQPWVPIPRPSEVRPTSFSQLPGVGLHGLRIAVPRNYVNGDPESRYPIETRASVMSLWHDLRTDLEAAGAEVIETDFPVVDNYERQHPGDKGFIERGLVTEAFLREEIGELSVWALDFFLRRNGDSELNSLSQADASRIFPHPTGALPDRYGVFDFDIAYDITQYVAMADEGVADWRDLRSLESGLRGLERTRQDDFESWMAENSYDAVLFPTAADVGPADADVNPDSADLAWRNGVWVSNGNLVPRHLGIPTLTFPIGAMSDTGMPVGVTLMSAAYRDAEMLQLGVAIADLRPRRVTPPRTPPLADEAVFSSSAAPADEPLSVSIDSVEVKRTGSHTTVRFTASVTAGEAEEWVAYVDGRPAPAIRDGDRVVGMVRAGSDAYTHRHSEWRAAYGPLVTVAIRSASGAVAGAVGTTATGPL